MNQNRRGKRKPASGEVLEIADLPHGYYYVAIAIDGDCLFFDRTSDRPIQPRELEGVPFFLRLPVMLESASSRWRSIGNLEVAKELATYGKYAIEPLGEDKVFILDHRDGSVSPSTIEATAALEWAGVWDLTNHILPVLRFHFFRIPSPHVSEVRTPI